MGSRFEKFSERARKVLSLAQEEAQRFNHNYIGTEHILLGLVRETEGVAARVLANVGVDLNKVRSAVEFIIGRGDKPAQGEIGLTPRAKKVVELAVDEARRMNPPTSVPSTCSSGCCARVRVWLPESWRASASTWRRCEGDASRPQPKPVPVRRTLGAFADPHSHTGPAWHRPDSGG